MGENPTDQIEYSHYCFAQLSNIATDTKGIERDYGWRKAEK